MLLRSFTFWFSFTINKLAQYKCSLLSQSAHEEKRVLKQTAIIKQSDCFSAMITALSNTSTVFFITLCLSGSGLLLLYQGSTVRHLQLQGHFIILIVTPAAKRKLFKIESPVPNTAPFEVILGPVFSLRCHRTSK